MDAAQLLPYLHRISRPRRLRGDAQDRRFQELAPSPVATGPERSRHDGAHRRLADRGPRRTADDGGDGMTPSETEMVADRPQLATAWA